MNRKDIVIVAPDYRVSQKHPYPSGFDDCYDVLLWMRDNAEEFNIDSNNFIVAGHSAGGGLTAAVTLKARNTGDVKIAFQMPIYPMLDYRMGTASSQMQGSPVWDANINRKAWQLYLRHIKGNVPSYASPALNSDYHDFPPTISFVGDLEPFHDECVVYMDALKQASVPIKFKVFKGAYHGFEIGSPNAIISMEANKFQLDAFEVFYNKYIKLWDLT